MYEEFYHLRAKPFRLSPDPGFYFASRGHKRALAYLRYGLNQSEGFVVITGDPGTGKTTLAQILLQEMGQLDVVVAHLTTTQLEADDMLRMVVASYGLRYEGVDKAGLLKTLEAFLLARSRERKRALLVVDEAQNLPPKSVEELRMLSNLQVGGQALLQIFMLGQAQFRQMLDRPDLEQLRQRVIANYHLSALAADECKSYVESRLTQVGWQDDPHITEEAYDIIFNYTAGIPRRINMLCDRVLLFSCLEDQHIIDEKLLRDVTDELQSEVSGRPVKLEESGELNAALNETPIDLGIEPESKAAEKHSQSSVDIQIDTKTYQSSRSTTPEFQKQAEVPTVESPISTKESQVEGVPENDWSQSVARAKREPADVETEVGVGTAEEAEKLLDKDRFRVITGGKTYPGEISVKAKESSTEVMAPIPDANGDSQEVVLRKVLRLVLAFHRSPRSFPGLDNPSQPLPKGMHDILLLAVADDNTINGLRQIAVMGISPAMLRAAVRFFARRVMFIPEADDYRILGLMPGASLPDVEEHYGLLMRLLRQEKPNADDSGVTLVGKAYERLCRVELSFGAIEPQNDSPDNDDESDTLDLDLSPAALEKNDNDRRITSTVSAVPESLDMGDSRTPSTGRNIILLLGAVAVVIALYMTDIIGPVDTSALFGPESVESESRVAESMMLEQIRVMPLSLPTEEMVSGALENDLVNTENNTSSEVTTAAQTESVVTDETPASSQAGEKKADTLRQPVPVQKRVEQSSKNSAPQVGTTQSDVNEAALAELQAKAEAATQAQREAEAQAEASALEIEWLKQVEQARVAEEVRARQAAEKMAKTKALELKELKAELNRLAEARVLAEAQADNEAKARAEAELRAAQEAEERARREEDARVAEQRRIEAEKRARQAEELARQQALQQAEARALEAIEERDQLVASAEEAEKLIAITAEQSVDVRTAEEAGKISQSDLQAVVQQFERFYANGDAQGLMELFAVTARTNQQISREGIRASYQALFESTTARSITFKEIVWEREDDYARGNGAYEFNLRVNDGSVDIKGQGDMVLQFERQAGQLLITRIYFSDKVPDQSVLKKTDA